MLPVDSLVIDLIFKAGAQPEPEALVQAFGGEEALATRKLLDPDMIDPRFEMTMAPSMPLRRRDERRLLIIDDSVAPLRADLEKNPVSTMDLREEKERLVTICQSGDVRVGRVFGFGLPGDAVMVAQDARDLRGVALITWALDPQMDVDGKRRANQLTQQEFEQKLLAFEKRLEELDEQAILGNLGAANFERRDNLLVVDVLENDGTWDLRKSIALLDSLAAIDQFSMIPGAPQSSGASPTKAKEPAPAPPPAQEPAPTTADDRPPLRKAEIGKNLLLIFPKERFDLDVAASMGKRDWESVVARQDPLEGQDRDRLYRDGAQFLAPLEFLSEVFYEGKPLSKPDFERVAKDVEGARALEVHCPRFGPVILLEHPERGRFISSETEQVSALLSLLP